MLYTFQECNVIQTFVTACSSVAFTGGFGSYLTGEEFVQGWPGAYICRAGQNCIYTPYMAVCMVISLPKIPYVHRIYMVLANPTDILKAAGGIR